MFATALMGGHTIGGANSSQSGYSGNFTGNMTSPGRYDLETIKFSNEYYR